LDHFTSKFGTFVEIGLCAAADKLLSLRKNAVKTAVVYFMKAHGPSGRVGMKS